MKLFNTNKFGKILIIAIIAIEMSLAGPSYAATEDLVVDFESTPLFSEANFLPGNTVTRTVGVTNNAGSSKDIIVEAINVTDPDDFASALNLVITEGDGELYNDTLADFFDAGEVDLSSVAGSGGSATYDFSVSFVSGSGNSYQENDLGFDIVIGFAGDGGGDGEEEGEGGGGGGSGGGGCGSGVPGGLSILNETVQVLDIETTSVTIVWDTSYRSTSRVVYGTSPDLFDFNNMPNYGYPFSTVEIDSPASSTGVFDHSVTISGLSSGTTYYFRAISHASPDSVSFEHSFTTTGLSGAPVNDGSVAGIGAVNPALSGGSAISRGESGNDQLVVSGGQDQEGQTDVAPSVTPEVSEEDRGVNDDNNLLASIGGLLGSVSLWWLLVLLLVIIVGIYTSKKKNRE